MIRITGEIHSSKNSRQIFRNRKTNRPYVSKSKSAKNDESLLAYQFADAGNRADWLAMIAGRPFPLLVFFRFHRETKARWDFANLVQGVADAMVKAEYLPDDSVDYFIPVYGGHEVDRNFPGVEIWVA